MEDLLTDIWKKTTTKQLATIFENYMKSIGVRKFDGRRKDNSNTYMVSSEENWNRVHCFYNKENDDLYNEDLLMVLRKESGSYLIIQRKGEYAFSIGNQDKKEYNKGLMCKILKEHKDLFNILIGKELLV